MFEAIKEKYNLERNTEVIRLIIKLAYDCEFNVELVWYKILNIFYE